MLVICNHYNDPLDPQSQPEVITIFKHAVRTFQTMAKQYNSK